MSPREYQARLDLLRVQDCVWARMKPAEIARKLGKDKAWVSRAIQKLETERASAYRSAEERDLIGENLRQLDSLLAKALAAAHGGKDAKTQLAALRTAADVLRQKADYEMAVGLVQGHRERGSGGTGGFVERERTARAVEFYECVQEELPQSAVAAILQRLSHTKLKRQPSHFLPTN